MLRRRYGVSLARSTHETEDVNPNSYLVNVADCMLVLLLGVIVALIAYYNVDLSQAPEPKDEIVGVQVNMDSNDDGAVDSNYERRGSVYYDDATGEYYFVSEGGA